MQGQNNPIEQPVCHNSVQQWNRNLYPLYASTVGPSLSKHNRYVNLIG